MESGNIGDWFDKEIASKADWDGDLNTELVQKVDASEDYILKRLLAIHSLPFDARRGTYSLQELSESVSNEVQQEIFEEAKKIFLKSLTNGVDANTPLRP